jgi:hypothetical protein
MLVYVSYYKFLKYFVAYFFLNDWIAIVHFITIAVGVDLIRTWIPKGLTFAEALSSMSIMMNFFAFFLESARFQMKSTGIFIAGNNAHNLLIFSPVFSFL